MSDYIKVGDECVVLPGCEGYSNRRLIGTDVIVVSAFESCMTDRAGIVYGYWVRSPLCPYGDLAYRAEHLRKKNPPKQHDAEPRADFTPAQPEFVEDLQRRLTRTTEVA